MTGIFDQGLDRNAANFAALSPVSFVERSAEIYGDLPAVIHGARRYVGPVRERAARLAAALRAAGVGRGSTVSVMLPNTPEMVEAHYAVPALERGAQHAEHPSRCGAARVADEPLRSRGRDHRPRVRPHHGPGSCECANANGRVPIVIDVCDSEYTGPGERLGEHEYEALLRAHEPLPALDGPRDEWDAIAVSYTSGTTGDPKGVVTHHRGAYLNAVCNAATWTMPQFPVYLWTLPMFHCNGWCFPWTVAPCSAARTCACAAWRPVAIFAAIREHRADHYCAAPIVHNMLIAAPASCARGSHHRARHGRRRRAAGVDDRRHGADRLRPHARLWPDRGLRPGGGGGEAAGLGGTAVASRRD